MAITVDGSFVLGGRMRRTYGSWTATAGGADQTLTLQGGQVYHVSFQTQDGPSKPTGPDPKVTTSVSGSVITTTLKSRETVTTGRFIVDHQ